MVAVMVGNAVRNVENSVQTIMAKTRNIDVLIEKDPNTGLLSSTDFFLATFGGLAGGHYEGMK